VRLHLRNDCKSWQLAWGSLRGCPLARDTFSNIVISIATNTALFTGLDLGQWIADTLSLWTLPAT
jgi:hypothetical protein